MKRGNTTGRRLFRTGTALLLVVAMLPALAAPGSAAPSTTGPVAGARPGAVAEASTQTVSAEPDLSCTAAKADAATAAATARACGQRVEVIDERTETAEHFVNPDGTRSAKIYGGQVRMRVGNALVPVDLTLRAAADGSVAPIAHPGGLRLSGPAGAGTNELLSIAAGAGRVAIGWEGALPTPALAGNRATYRDVRPGVDLIVEATRGGVEQFLIVKTRAAAAQVASVRLPLTADGLRLADDGNGGTVIRDAKGAIVATSPTPEMWDASVDPLSGRPARVSVVASTRLGAGTDASVLRLAPSARFLDDPAVLYPVTIDPSINPIYDTFDTTVKEGDTIDRSGSDVMSLGWAHGASPGVARSFIHWPVSALKGTKVTNATVNFWNYFSATCSPRQWQVWSTGPASTETRWTNQPAWLSQEATSDQTAGFDTTCNDNWISASGTAFFDRAAAAQQDTAYMGLRSAFEGQDVTYWKDLRTNRSDNADHIPYAAVTYNSYPNALPAATLEPGDAAELGTRTPVMRGVFSDPDGGTGRVDFEIYDRSGSTLVTSGSGTTVTSGATSSWTVPAGRLAANTTYRWRARGHDGSLGGPWSGWRFMTTSDGSPTGDQARFSFQEESLTDRLHMKVNVANGNLLLGQTDLSVRGTGLDLVLDHYYNSRSTLVSTLGKGWTLGTAQDVNLLFSGSDHATADVTYRAPTGFTARFINDGANSWRTPPSIEADLSRNTTTGELRLRFDKSEGSFFFADANGRLLRIVDRNNNRITFGYDASGRVTTITDTQARVVTLAYTSGRLASATDSTGRRVSFGYDAAQNLQTVTDAAGGVTRYDYTGDRPTRITTPEGRVVNIGYEPDTSRMIDFYERTSPGGTPAQARYAFAYLAGRTEVTDPNGSATATAGDGVTTHTYEARDRVTKVRDPLGHERSNSYNANDNVEVLTDALTNTVTLGWDPNTNNMTSVTTANGARSTLSYGSTAHPHSVTGRTDSQGNVLGYAYDVAGNKTATTSDQYPGQEIEDLRYNANGTVDYRLDGRDVKTDFTYDAKGNLTRVDNPAPLGDVTILPDALSRMQEHTDGKGQRTQYVYDKLDRIDRITFQGGAVVDFTYDRDGNLTSVGDPTGTTTMAYDGFGRTTSKTSPGTGTVRYGYDRNGNLTKFTDSGGDVVYAYNQANLLTSLSEPGATAAVTFTYDANNRRRFMFLPTSPRVTVEMRYDASGRQTLVEARNDATGARLSSFAYSYSRNGVDTSLRQSMTDLSGTTSYSYDKLNRLIGATGPGLTRNYAYDINFNRTSKTENGTSTSYTYNDAHMLTAAGSTTYAHDANGNLASSSSGWALSYNAINNQTTSITKPGGSALSPLRYAGQDQTERVRAGATDFVHAALGVSSASTASGGSTSVGADSVYPAAGTTAYYTRDTNGNLISLRTGGARYYYLVDGLGSVTGLVNGSAALVNSYRYDPYGKQLSASQQVANPWRFAGGFYDGSTGLTKFGARYYDADLGRFTQRDPSGMDLPYSYAGCDPVNHTDPTGLSICTLTIQAFVMALGAAFFGGLWAAGGGIVLGVAITAAQAGMISSALAGGAATAAFLSEIFCD